MKRKVPGVTDELLASAKAEFLENGYMNANLRRIARESGVSTNSIYGRFRDKAGLFDALVKEPADVLYEMIREMNESAVMSSELDEKLETDDSGTKRMLDYIYDNFDAFQLIFTRSAGTEYENYLDRLSALEESAYKVQVESMGMAEQLSDFFIHAVVAEGYRYLYEIVAHELTRQEAAAFMNQITEFRAAGWRKILG